MIEGEWRGGKEIQRGSNIGLFWHGIFNFLFSTNLYSIFSSEVACIMRSLKGTYIGC